MKDKWKYKIAKQIWRITKPVTAGARVILAKDEKVLLVKHTYQSEWYLPGGGAKKGETYEETARRELIEELGVTLFEIRLLGVYNNFYEGKNDTVVVFSSENFTIEKGKNSEVERFDFFLLDRLPARTSKGTRKRIEEYANKKVNLFGLW